MLFAAGLTLLLVLFAAGVSAAAFRMPADMPLTIQPLAMAEGGAAPELTRGGDGICHPGGDAVVRARIQFVLPPRSDASSRWAVVFGRDPYDQIQLTAGSWQSAQLNFYRPETDVEGAIPNFFIFVLPPEMAGPVQVDVTARSGTVGALRPFVMLESTAHKMEQRSIALTVAAYAGLFMLALVMLALFHAAHDRAFLSFFAFSISALLLLAALNGHLYLLPGFRLLGAWRDQGISALLLLFSASALYILSRYADLPPASRLAKFARFAQIVLLVLSAVALMGIQPLRDAVVGLTLLGWIAAGTGCVAIGIDAARRGVRMAWPITVLCAATVLAALGYELMARGVFPDLWWIRRGYQLALLMVAALLAVGLAIRLGNYRDQRDYARLAREDSELRVSRQTARLSLAEGLQAQLKHLPQGDVEWTAYRRVIEHLVPMLQLQSLAVVAWGSEHQELLLVEPIERKDQVAQAIAKRHNMLKSLARTRAPLQVSMYEAPAGTEASESALVPLPLRAPAWGAMILERTHGNGFTTEELTLASEFGRLAAEAVDEANTSLRLRRSAELDALTGSFNRRTLDQWLTRCFADAHRANKDVSVLFVDLDHFKHVNDTHGHAAGDHCLRHTSAALRDAIGPSDLLGRYGGEEFMVVLPDATSDSARKLGEAIRDTVENLPIEWHGQALNITVSVGVATRWPHEQTPTAAIERADKALYAAKRAGRNRVHVAPAEFF
ncbi:MAG: GGDEF domain-containing protein [Pseudomonadota bacterium]|nr:GGDEF domain-containing protein [Pseudomonadota bacterium]